MDEKTRTVVFNVAAVLLLAGAGGWLMFPDLAPYLFAAGTAGYAFCHLTLPAKGMDLRSRRLRRYNIFAALLCVFASVLMFKGRKEWILCLSIAALLQLYTAFVTPKGN